MSTGQLNPQPNPPPNPQSNPQQEETPARPKKRCRVCGTDNVRCAFNYNGLCCEGCKSYFRRNAFTRIGAKCKLDTNCDTSEPSRRFCSNCRIKRCFVIGMRTEFFRDHPNNPKNIAREQQQLLQLRQQQQDEQRQEQEQEDQLQQQPQQQEEQLQPQEQPQVVALPARVNYYQHCLNAFRASLEVVVSSPLRHRNRVIGAADQIRQLVSPQVEKRFIHELVRYSYALGGFNELDPIDKTALIGQSFSQVLLLRSVFHFSAERDSLVVLLDGHSNTSMYTSLDVFYQRTQGLVTVHRTLVQQIRLLMQGDIIVQELTVVLQMLQYYQYSLLCPEVIRYLFKKYSFLLQLYLTEKYGEVGGTLTHHQLLALIDQTGPLKTFIDQISEGIKELPDRESFVHFVNSLMN